MPNVKDRHGTTPFHFAAGQEHKELVELLLTSKAKVNAKAREKAQSFRAQSSWMILSTSRNSGQKKGWRQVGQRGQATASRVFGGYEVVAALLCQNGGRE